MSEVHEDDLIYRLDGSSVSNERGSWSITVYCVYTVADQRWLQLGLIGARDYALTLRMSLAAEATEARGAIAEWLRNPVYGDGDIVSVA
jgi:hypothetical protein